jgi:hypothetical protein
LTYTHVLRMIAHTTSLQNNTFVYVDYNPAVYAHTQLGLHLGLEMSATAGQPTPPFEPKPGICGCMLASAPFAASGLQDQWWNNTCIASSSGSFFKWESCNSSAPLDGTIPFPIKTNRYFSSDGGYVMRCNADAWNFTEAQALGLDLGSTVATLPSLEELVAMGHDVLQF